MMTLITINRVYYLIGFVVMLLVVMTLRDRANPKRFTTALFWFLFGGIFLFGDLMVQELGKSLAYRIVGGGGVPGQMHRAKRHTFRGKEVEDKVRQPQPDQIPAFEHPGPPGHPAGWRAIVQPAGEPERPEQVIDLHGGQRLCQQRQ